MNKKKIIAYLGVLIIGIAATLEIRFGIGIIAMLVAMIAINMEDKND